MIHDGRHSKPLLLFFKAHLFDSKLDTTWIHFQLQFVQLSALSQWKEDVCGGTGNLQLGASFTPFLADNWCQTASEINQTDFQWNVQLPNSIAIAIGHQSHPARLKKYGVDFLQHFLFLYW